jgi:hypothetical protein
MYTNFDLAVNLLMTQWLFIFYSERLHIRQTLQPNFQAVTLLECHLGQMVKTTHCYSDIIVEVNRNASVEIAQ